MPSWRYLIFRCTTAFGRGSFDRATLDRLHRKAMIENPAGKTKSVVFTDEGLAQSERLFEKMFAKAE